MWHLQQPQHVLGLRSQREAYHGRIAIDLESDGKKKRKTRGEKLAENAAQQGRATCLAWPGETFSANISTDHRRSSSIADGDILSTQKS